MNAIERIAMDGLLKKLNKYVEKKAAEFSAQQKEVVIMYFESELYFTIPSKKVSSTKINLEEI